MGYLRRGLRARIGLLRCASAVEDGDDEDGESV